MPSNEQERMDQYQKPSTVARLITRDDYRAEKQHQADADELADDFARGLNEAMRRGEMPNV